jgi:hypothetical protein
VDASTQLESELRKELEGARAQSEMIQSQIGRLEKEAEVLKAQKTSRAEVSAAEISVIRKSLEESQIQNRTLEDEKSQLKVKIQKALEDKCIRWEKAQNLEERLETEAEELRSKITSDTESAASEIGEVRKSLEKSRHQIEDEQAKSKMVQNDVERLEKEAVEHKAKSTSNAEGAALEKAELQKLLEEVQRQLDNE